MDQYLIEINHPNHITRFVDLGDRKADEWQVECEAPPDFKREILPNKISSQEVLIAICRAETEDRPVRIMRA